MRLQRPSTGTLVSIAAFVLGVVVLLVLPRWVGDFRLQQLAYVGIYFLALIGLNILTGYTGQISLGHGAFMAIGGYTTAILVSDQGLKLGGHVFGGSPDDFTGDLKDLWTIPIAAVVCFAAGLLFGLPALRLSGLYLALATFAIAVATPAVLKRFEGFTGGGSGINLFGVETLTGAVDGVTVFGRTLTFNEWLYYLSWTIAMFGLAVAWLLLRGRTGRAFRAVRDSETAAASSGVNLALYKTLAFGISAAFAGVAGSLFAIATTFVNPDTFPIALSIFLLVGVVVGGLGSLYGLLAGAVFIYFMQASWAQQADRVVPDFLPWIGDLSTSSPGAPAVAFGVALILLMLLLPSGAAGLIRLVASLARRLPGPSQ
jgi:branched-chain amino acid transport system permease protein